MKANKITTFCLLSFYSAVFVLLFGTSCKRILDAPSVSESTSENLFQTVVQAKQTVLGIYYTFTKDIYSRKLNSVFSADTDETQAQGTVDPSGRRMIARYTSTPSGIDDYMAPVWNTLYAGIERANICIQRIPAMDLYKNGQATDQAELRRLYGESLTLRAVFAFDLIKLWGDVPFKTTPSTAGEDLFASRMSRDSIYDQIIKDLQLAVTLVPWRKDVTADYRWTKGAVKGILARIALHAAGYSLRWDLSSGGNIGMRTRPDADKIRAYYQIAHDACADIINDPAANHRLNPDYKSIWKNLCSKQMDTQYGESMFEIAFYNPTGDQDYNGYIGNKIGVTSSCPADGNGGTEILMMPPYYLSFDTLDVRRDVTVADFNINSSCQRVITSKFYQYTPGKWRVWWGPIIAATNYTGINWILLRYSDVLLMYAEADSWLNQAPTADAVNALRQVRLRAYKGNEALVNAESYPSDLAGFTNVLMQERAWELGAEGIRKWDLIRWNKLSDVLNTTKSQLTQEANDATIPMYIDYLPQNDLESENPHVFSNSSSVAQPYKGLGYVSASYRKDMSTSIPYFAMGFVTNKTELFPIPQSVMDADPKLSQHPLY